MTRTPPKARPGSKTFGRTLVAQADYMDLVKRRAALKSLISRAEEDISAAERQIAMSFAALARKLELSLATKRNFRNMLGDRLKAIEDNLADIERQNLWIAEKQPL